MLSPSIQRLTRSDSHFAEAAWILLSESLPNDLYTAGWQVSPAFLSYDNSGLNQKDNFFL